MERRRRGGGGAAVAKQPPASTPPSGRFGQSPSFGERSPLSPDDALALFSPVSVLMSRSMLGLQLNVPQLARHDSDEGPVSMGSSPSTPGFVPPLFAEATEARPCPPTPYRPLHKMSRQDSLRETKLLVAAGGAPGSVGPTPEFDAENFTFVQLIGSSPTSEVWLVRSRHDGSLSAVKRSVAAFTGRADRARMLREIQAAASMPDHPRVVRYYRGWQQDAHFYVQMELCEGGSLAGVLAALPAGMLLPEADVWRLAAELADGLAHCHAHGVNHMDVKPANVFLDADASAKLGDFGLALLAGRGWGVEEGDGGYVPPELLLSEPRSGAHSDVFSLGATLVEAASGAPPPRGAYGAAVTLPGGRSPQLVALLQAMLQPDFTRRPTAREVLAVACAALGRTPPD